MAQNSNSESLLERISSRHRINIARLNNGEIADLIDDISLRVSRLKIDNDVNPKLLEASKKFAYKYIKYRAKMERILTDLNNLQTYRNNYNNLLQAFSAGNNTINELDIKTAENLYNRVHHMSEDSIRPLIAKSLGEEIVKAQEEYEYTLNSILGHHMEITYTTEIKQIDNNKYEGGEVYVFKDNQDFSKYMIYGLNLNSNTSQYYFAKIRYDFDALIANEQIIKKEMTQQFKSEPMSLLRWARFSSEWRFKRSRTRHSKDNDIGHGFKGLILWKSNNNAAYIMPSGWAGLWVREISNIAEAYTAVVVENKVDEFISHDINILLDTFLLEFLQYVDSVPGPIKGDTKSIMEEDNENIAIENAIKAAGGAMAGTAQFFNDYAAKIFTKTDNFSEQKLRDTYDNLLNSNVGMKTKILDQPESVAISDAIDYLIDNINGHQNQIRCPI